LGRSAVACRRRMLPPRPLLPLPRQPHLPLPCLPAETGEIYHLTFKPPPPEIVGRLVRGAVGWAGRRGRLLSPVVACARAAPGAVLECMPHLSPTMPRLPRTPSPPPCRCSAATTRRRRRATGCAPTTPTSTPSWATTSSSWWRCVRWWWRGGSRQEFGGQLCKPQLPALIPSPVLPPFAWPGGRHPVDGRGV
jgi:hypothetical protein